MKLTAERARELTNKICPNQIDMYLVSIESSIISKVNKGQDCVTVSVPDHLAHRISIELEERGFGVDFVDGPGYTQIMVKW